ncbi:MAG TPA: NCS2 family permease, partial [Clostridia bacterium]|nr:NCS2 family permease [Clostridia bacterium]
SLFKLQENNTDVRTEVLAGITTFMTMSYIIFVNPSILSEAGMPWGAVFTATCIAAALATFIMGFFANYPFALAPGMGLNAYFTYTVVMQMGLSWQAALAAVFISGLIFIILTLTKAREAIINSIPMSLKLAVSAGIGLFIALIGFSGAGIIVSNPDTLMSLGNFREPGVIVAALGIIITGILVVRRVKGALLIGIVFTTVLGIPFGVTSLENFGIFSAPPPVTETLGAFTIGFKEVLTFGLIPVIFAFTFVDLFDTIGTLIGVSSKAGMLDKNGNLPRANKALMADAVGTVAGSMMGTSTVTTYVESASGVAEGGRTGLTAVVAGVLFLVALFFSPLVGIVPGEATAPILIIVGIFMMEPVMKINFSDYLEAIPAFLAIVMMPFAYSIAEGIVFGILAYTFLHLLAGKAHKISLTMWILTLLFMIRFFV